MKWKRKRGGQVIEGERIFPSAARRVFRPSRMGIGRRKAEQKSGACRFFGKGIPKKMEIDRFTGEFCPGSNCPIPKKWGLIVSGEIPKEGLVPFRNRVSVRIVRRGKTCGRQRIPREKAVRS